MDPIITGALINGAFGLGQSLWNKNAADKAATKEYNRQLEFWNMQNKYNDPGNQRMRLQNAGFNPAAAVGEVGQGNTAGELSSVPGNDYAKEGFLKLQGFADTLEVLARIEKLGAETGLITSQVSTEGLRQILMGMDINEKEIDYIIKSYEAEAKELELENLPEFYRHQRTMYSYDEQLAQSKIAHEDALKALTEAQTEESKASAQKIAAETGLVLLKQETEKSIAALNYAFATKAKNESEKIKWETQKSMVLAPFERQAMKLANDLQATEQQKAEIEAALKQLDLDAKSNPEGKPNAWYYIDRTLDTIGGILGVAAGAYLGGKTGAKAKPVGTGSGLYVPGSTNFNGQNFGRM